MEREEIADKEALLRKLREMNIAELTGNTHNESMSDILHKISDNKRMLSDSEASQMAPPGYVPPGGWKPAPEYPGVIENHSKSMVALSNPHTLDRFRHKTSKWDNTMHTSKYLLHTLYRVPDRDPSGKRIDTLGRDEPKGVTTWNPPIDGDRDLPRVDSSLCSPSFRKVLDSHLEKVVSRTQKEYITLPQHSDRLRQKRAEVGRDLNNLAQEYSLILESEERDKGMSSKCGSLKSKSRISKSVR